MNWKATITILAGCLVGVCAEAGAEPYVLIQGGVSKPFAFNHWKSEYFTQGWQTNDDLGLKTAGAFGGKVGYFFDSHPWLGVELDYLWTTPHLKQQDTTIVYQARESNLRYNVPGSYFHVSSLALNLVLRYPGESWQPYLAAGPARFDANMGGDPMNWNIGLNTEAGVRYRWGHLLLSLAYKYQQTHMTLTEWSNVGDARVMTGQSGWYQNQFVLAGIGVAF